MARIDGETLRDFMRSLYQEAGTPRQVHSVPQKDPLTVGISQGAEVKVQ